MEQGNPSDHQASLESPAGAPDKRRPAAPAWTSHPPNSADTSPEERRDAHVGGYSMLGSYSSPPLICAAAPSRPAHYAAMPCIHLREPEPHRPRNLREYARQFPHTACVARPVQRKEIASNPKAKQSMTNEWQRLRDQNVWDESDAREWDDVRDEAQREGFDVHM